MWLAKLKGQSNTILAAIFISVFLISLLPLAIYIYQSSLNSPSQNPMQPGLIGSMGTRGDIYSLYDENTMGLLIGNNGGTDIELNSIVIQVACGGVSNVLRIDRANISSKTIPSGGSISLNLSRFITSTCTQPVVKSIQLVTQSGAIVPARVISPQELLSQPQQAGSQTTTPIATPIMIIPLPVNPGEDLSNSSAVLSGIFTVLTPQGRGMTGGWNTTGNRYVWKLDKNYTNVDVSINNQYYHNIWIRYDPKNTSRYNILITADNISLDNPRYSLNSEVRVKIYGFTPSTNYIVKLGNLLVTNPPEMIAGYYYTYNGYDPDVKLSLSGSAEKVEIYIRVSEFLGGSETGYDPYILLMNNRLSRGVVGILFTTIDRIFGWKNTVNEYYTQTNYNYYGRLRDYSTIPLLLVYKGFNLSNTEYSGVILTVNYQFIDNEGSDQDGVTVNKPIFILGLVEEVNGQYQVYTYRNYTFWELTRYEDTFPPVSQMQSSVLFFPLPDQSTGEREFYVFLSIQDPYWYNGVLDDLDFALYIESLVLIPVRR